MALLLRYLWYGLIVRTVVLIVLYVLIHYMFVSQSSQVLALMLLVRTVRGVHRT